MSRFMCKAPGALLVVLVALGACGAGIKSTFRPMDANFVSQPGAEPTVYLYPADVPKVAWHSVGIVEITIPGSSELTDTLNAAAAKGKEVGCAALIEHSVFAHMQSHAWYGASDSAPVVLAHGGSSSAPSPRASSASEEVSPETTQFDCVVRAEEPTNSVATLAPRH